MKRVQISKRVFTLQYRIKSKNIKILISKIIFTRLITKNVTVENQTSFSTFYWFSHLSLLRYSIIIKQWKIKSFRCLRSPEMNSDDTDRRLQTTYVCYFFGMFCSSHPDRTVRNHCSSILRRCTPSLAAILAGLLHVKVPVLGNPPRGLKLLQPSTPFQFPHSECPLEHRYLEAIQLVEHLLKEPLQFSDHVVLVTIPFLLWLMVDNP